MRLVLNVIWLVFSGLVMALAWLLAAVVMFILIITIPFGIQALKIAGFALWPFGRTLVKRPDAGAPHAIGNVIWFVLAGWWLAIAHLIFTVLYAITIIGLPLAAGHWKLIGISLAPFGREVVPTDATRPPPAGAVTVG
jgi:uncharacterized membrane protein YccF (DUF307 family)